MKLTDYEFPVPPVCTAKWDDAAWLRWAQLNGRRIAGKPSLKEAAGKFLHASQAASWFGPSSGARYDDLPPEDFERKERAGWSSDPLFRVLPERKADWGWGSYLVKPDGQLELACFAYDSSG